MAEIKKKVSTRKRRLSPRKTSKKKTKLKKWLIGIGAVLLLLTIVAAIIILPYITTKSDVDATIYLRKGSDMNTVKEKLKESVNEKFADKVVSFLKLTHTDVSNRQGAYSVKKGESALTFARRLRNGVESEVRVIINCLRTKEDLAARLAKTLMLPKEDFLKALNDEELCKTVGMTTDNITALFLSDTYQFLWDAEPDKVIKQMKRFSDKFWNEERKSKAQKLGLTPYEVVTLASIVEGETTNPEEKGKVARLYLNRLKKNMKLQADPTVKFALKNFAIRRITYEDLKVQSPWNTYYVTGLPPGPICMPEKASIDAVLNAPEHNYIFMAAKGDGSGCHNFAETYSEHEINAAKYHQIIKERGIRR